MSASTRRPALSKASTEAWQGAAFKPKGYVAGTWGPQEAGYLLSRTGRQWNTGHE